VKSAQGVVVAFNRDSLWGTVETIGGAAINFHSTSYQGRDWPFVGSKVEVVYNSRGGLLAVHEK
jgi:hypothetical protein